MHSPLQAKKLRFGEVKQHAKGEAAVSSRARVPGIMTVSLGTQPASPSWFRSVWETRRPGSALPDPHKACAVSSHFLQTDQDQASCLFQLSAGTGFVKQLHKGLDGCPRCPHPDQKEKRKGHAGQRRDPRGSSLKARPLCRRPACFPRRLS